MRHHVKALGFGVAAASLLAAVQAPPAWADLIGTFVSGNTTVTEGSTTTLVFKVTNSYSVSYTREFSFLYPPSHISGDRTDSLFFDGIFNFSPAGYTGCGATLAAGASCYYSVTLDTPSGSGETDQDSGNWWVTTITDWRNGEHRHYAYGYTDITVVDPVSDPAPDPVPEPGSLALLGSGLIGFVFLYRRKRAVAAR